jgi:choline dehydrogenase-like flavoprotein
MIVDSGALPADQTLQYDACVVGSGPAGLTLARELGAEGLRVCVLESGTFEASEGATRSLSELASEGNFVQVNPDQRNRRFGGNAGFWGVHLSHTTNGVRLIPYVRSDFERREGVPHSGWPFSREYLDPWYARAQQVLGAGPYAYELQNWVTPETPPLPFSDRLQTAIFMFGNGEMFTQTYRRELELARNITVYTSSNALELETDETGQRVERVRVGTVEGLRFTIEAKVVLLAAGGVENTHLLLLSDKVHKNGLGNEHDVLGRYFMDHPIAEGGHFYPKDRRLFERTALYDKRPVKDAHVMGGILISDDLVIKESLLNLTTWIFPRPMWAAREDSMKALRRFARGKSLAAGPKAAWADFTSALKGGSAVMDGIYNKATGVPFPFWPNLAEGEWHRKQDRKHRAYGVFEVLHLLEQAPDPENRLVLIDELDVLGRRKAKLITRWREIDRRGVDKGQQLLDEELRANKLGHFEPHRTLDNDLIWSSLGASHHMGTARMHENPRKGVVDANGKVHGVHNLYVTGSAVFPTGSSLNPTLTICALAARLADHVKLQLGREQSVSTT